METVGPLYGWIYIPPDLKGIQYLIPSLQIFSHKVRTGVLAAKRKAIQAQIMEEYLCSMGKIFAEVGYPGPKLNSVGYIDFHLGQTLTTYHK